MNKWQTIEPGWHCLQSPNAKTLASVCKEADGRWHCYISSSFSQGSFSTLKEAKAFCGNNAKGSK